MDDRRGVNAINTLCVVLGRPGVDPVTVVGPFEDEQEARQHAQQHMDSGAKAAVVDILINPTNC